MKNCVFIAIIVLLSGCVTEDQGASVVRRPEPQWPPIPTLNYEYPVGALVQGRLSGQVFIVTRGHETIKLSLVRVLVFPEQYVDYIRSVEKDLQAKTISACDAVPGYDPESAMIRVDGAANTIWDLVYQIARPSAEATTDADGHFLIVGAIPARWAIVAETDRQVFDETEHYRWVVRSSELADPETIVLSNTNLDH